VITFAFTGHRRRLRLAVHAAVLLVWAAVGVAVIAGNAEALPIALWALAGAALLWNGGRRGAGRETVTLTPALLVLSRDVGPFRLQRRFELYRIAGVRSIRLPGLTGGRHRIEFRYDGRPRRFGRGLSSREAQCIVGLLRRATLLFDGLP
jgi:hypothetical protein